MNINALEIVEKIEKYLSQIITDEDEYNISYDTIAGLCKMDKDDIDFMEVSLYAMHETITATDDKNNVFKYSLFIGVSGDGSNLNLKLNPKARAYFKMIQEENS